MFFSDVPVMALSATAIAEVEANICQVLRNPVIQRTSINRPNITLNVEELVQDKSIQPSMQFSMRAAEIAEKASAIIYTDFIADIGPIVSCLHEIGIEAVGYHGEMDIHSRHEAYSKWKLGNVQIIVATKAFGMGIDKSDIRNVIRNGVPESILSWTQELGRAGRDGKQACATILYRKSDLSHANAWILNNLQCKERILSGFSSSWRYVQAHLVGACRRQMLLDLFGETDMQAKANGACCDVCVSQESECATPVADMSIELQVLIDALNHVGCKGEVKVAEWIRGSKLSWTDAFDKKAMSYGNHCGKSIDFWRGFIRQCSTAQLISLELRSIIKSNGHYSVHAMYFPSEKGSDAICNEEQVTLPCIHGSSSLTVVPRNGMTSASVASEKQPAKWKRIGKGSHLLPVIRKCFLEPENWKNINSKQDYQYLGLYTHPCEQNLYFIPDITQLDQCSSDNLHFLWNDLQFSKGQLNKDRLIEVDIGGKKEGVYYRSAPCLGVKICLVNGCIHVSPIREKRPCPHHKNKLVKTEGCPVEFVYIYPQNIQDKRRWVGGFVRCQKEATTNLHNHLQPAATKMAECIRERIHNAVAVNPTLIDCLLLI